MGPLKPQLDALFRDTAACGADCRHWFDGPGLAWRQQLPVAEQAQVAIESLATTTRLMQVMSWLLHPAHAGVPAHCQPFPLLPDADLPATHPLAGQPGAAIANRSRLLANRARHLAESFAA